MASLAEVWLVNMLSKACMARVKYWLKPTKLDCENEFGKASTTAIA